MLVSSRGPQHHRYQSSAKLIRSRDNKKRLETLDAANATGPDNIPAIALKTCAPELAALLQYWHLLDNVEDCPGVSCTKVTKGVINSAIKLHVLGNNLLSDAQFGFHQGHSPPDIVTALVQTWPKVLNSR
eukprot:g47824.t1